MAEEQIEEHISIQSEDSIVLAGQAGRSWANRLGFTAPGLVGVEIAIKEVAYNILRYAGHGEVILSRARRQIDGRVGILVIARDQGPGIADVERALQGGHSTGRGLGQGLAGARRLMDEFEIVSENGHGTVVTMKKWA